MIHEPAQYKHSDVNLSGIFATAALLALTCVLVGALVWGLLHFLNAVAFKGTSNPMAEPLRAFPAPGLETTVSGELAEIRTAEDAHLKHYRWIDPSKEIAQIPIEEAMALISEKGMPDWSSEQKKKKTAAPPETRPQQEIQKPGAPKAGTGRTP